MSTSAPGFTTNTNTTESIAEWLVSPPVPDITEETQNMARNLDALYSPTIPSSLFQGYIEQFYSRALRLGVEHRRNLRCLSLPLTPALLNRARSIANHQKRIAQGFERILTDPDARANSPHKRLNETATSRALRLFSESYLTSIQAGLEADPEVWRIAHRLYALSCNERDLEPTGNPMETALSAYKRLLALATLGPQNLTPGELDWAAEFLAPICGQLHVQEQRPPVLDGSWYWLDTTGAAEPQACNRRDPLEGRRLLFFSTNELAKRTNDLLGKEKTGVSSATPDLSSEFPGVHPAVVLDHLNRQWMAPPQREQPRRKQDYQVDACVGLANIWAVLHGSRLDPQTLISHWTVTNESPGGYAIMHLQGRSSGLVAGTAVALRRSEEDAWNLCVIRWLRGDSSEHIEIGLQMVSRGAIPVQVGFRGTEKSKNMVNALVLPVLPALRQHQAILAPAGTYASRRFTLVSDMEKVYVAQCRLLTLDLQTSNIELFQFEIDPYPI